MPPEYPDSDIPETALDEVLRLTKLARVVDGARNADGGGLTARADDPETFRRHRDELLGRYGYVGRVREEPAGEVLVCYPASWIDEDGVVDPDAIEDTDEAIEIRLSGRGDQGEFESAEAHNRDLVEQVRDGYGDVHADNVAAFADFMGNHYARPLETATATELEEFLTEYYPRNVWPTEEQAAVLEQSLRAAFDVAEESYPLE